jgi:hypothetical protein
MNDRELIYEVYKKKQQKVQISPIKQELINFLEGCEWNDKMVNDYLSYWEKKTNAQRRHHSKEGEQITREEENNARIFTDEYLQNVRDIENITADNYPQGVGQTKENIDNNLYYDSLDRLKSLGLSEDHADELLRKVLYHHDADIAMQEMGI